jgi:L-threonylcarbamoyladenylate synthase
VHVTEVLVVDPLAPQSDRIARAAACLRDGGLVAFPTETVYGLGVHALDAAAVRRLFEAKGRPANDPLIVHVASLADAQLLVEAIPPSAVRLAARFWPGPLTLVLPSSARVPREVTAGLDTVAIRVPAHPVARALLAAAGLPIAAPSANLFSRPSPTSAQHVLEDLRDRIDMVIDGVSTDVGVESTVLDLTAGAPTVLRPGAVTLAMLRTVLPDVSMRDVKADADGAAQRSPGLLSKHYSPRAPLRLYRGALDAAVERMIADAGAAAAAGTRVAIIAASEEVSRVRSRLDATADIVLLGSRADLPTISARLYAALREADTRQPDLILLCDLASDASGLAEAIRDRLRRAATDIRSI